MAAAGNPTAATPRARVRLCHGFASWKRSLGPSVGLRPAVELGLAVGLGPVMGLGL